MPGRVQSQLQIQRIQMDSTLILIVKVNQKIGEIDEKNMRRHQSCSGRCVKKGK